MGFLSYASGLNVEKDTRKLSLKVHQLRNATSTLNKTMSETIKMMAQMDTKFDEELNKTAALQEHRHQEFEEIMERQGRFAKQLQHKLKKVRSGRKDAPADQDILDADVQDAASCCARWSRREL